MSNNIKIFKDPLVLSEQLTEAFISFVASKAKVTIALAGGSTPKIFYTTLSQPKYQTRIDWSKIHLFWGDERCVPADDAESNYRMVKESLLNHINIPSKNIHPVHGKNLPKQEKNRYSDEIQSNLPLKNGLPAFDWIFLGLGTDGHTASLFPNTENLKVTDQLCVVVEHPETGQQRISFTLPLLANAERISFLVTNKKKAHIIEKLLRCERLTTNYPASLLYEKRPDAEWWLDQDAAAYLHMSL